MHRRRETPVPHSRKDEKESLGEHVGYRFTRLERLSRRKSGRDFEIHRGRGEKFKGVRGTSGFHPGQ